VGWAVPSSWRGGKNVGSRVYLDGDKDLRIPMETLLETAHLRNLRDTRRVVVVITALQQ
jgi:hypothetical protein